MHIMLAEDVGPALLAMLLLIAALGTSALAWVGIAPAIFAKRVLTFCFIVPAFIVGIGATWWLAKCYIRVGVYDNDHFIENFLQPWIPMGGLPLVTVTIVVIVLFFRTRKRA